jgi:uncharacterized protein Yka (UPF0111/DUF47 family)
MGWRQPDAELLGLLDGYGATLRRAAGLLRDLFAELPDRLPLAAQIRDLEHDADAIAHEILQRVALDAQERPALDSSDVHALVTALDDVVDYADEAAEQVKLYDVEAPMEVAQQMTVILVAGTDAIAAALAALRGPNGMGEHLSEIRRLEKEGDRAFRTGVAALFRVGIDPMVVIRWKDIYETLEASVDACETVANVLEGMELKLKRR